MNLTSMEVAALKELAERQKMAIRIFRPLSHQDAIFEQPRCKYTLVSGGNRGGKTISLAELTAAVAMDEKITLSDGRSFDARMPWQKGKHLQIWIVCIDQRHIGDVIYPAIMKGGMFKVVTDPQTKMLRTFNPDTDIGLKPKLSPPLIPSRYVESISWDSKADRIFNRISIKNPATGEMMADIHAFTSKGDPPQGRKIDFCWCDEQLARDGYIAELQARLIDNDGQLVWSSWYDEDSAELVRFSQMVDREVELDSGIAKRVDLYLSANMHLGKKAIAEFRAGCATEEEWQQRDRGIAPSEKLRMYPLFDATIHTAILGDEDEDDKVSKILRRRDGIPPDDWTRILVLDPGTQHPAVLMCAIPPPEMGDYFVPYQELYPGRMDAVQLAEMVKKQTYGQRFHRFIIDRRAGRQTPMGYQTRVVDAYEDAFEAAKVKCTTTRHRFMFGCDDVGGRQMLLQSWMHLDRKGLPKLRVVTHRCKMLCEQLRKVKKEIVKKEVMDERKSSNQKHDICDALEYAVASKTQYYLPKLTVEDGTPAYQRYMRKWGRDTERAEPIQMGTYY